MMTKERLCAVLRDDLARPAWERGHLALAILEAEQRGERGSLWWHSLQRAARAVDTPHLEYEITNLEALCSRR